MRNPSTFLDDLQILLKVFQLAQEVLVYDPKKSLAQSATEGFEIVDQLNPATNPASGNKVLINLSNEKFFAEILKSFDFVLEFDAKPNSYKDFHTEIFYFINSPDGTIRWIFPTSLKYPGFLSLYNSSGLKASVFQQVAKLAFQTQTQHLICSGKLAVYSKTGKYVQSLYARESHSFSIFTGTVGPNRKAIIALHKERQTTHFIKYPLTENSKALINNEWDHLRCLDRFRFESIEVPKATQLSGGIKLSNIRPKNYFLGSSLQNLHYSAVTELYEQTTQYRSLSSIPGWNQSQNDIFSLLINIDDSGLSSSVKARQVIGKMYELSQELDEHLVIPIAYSHGDFTPWNMYVGKDRIYLYDWELASIHRPMLFDLFHFIFQSHVLMKRNSFKVISESINNMRRHTAVRKLIGKYDIDFDLHYRLYLLFNCAYYIKLYAHQNRIHKQVFWLIDCWTEAFQDLSAQKTLLSLSSRA